MANAATRINAARRRQDLRRKIECRPSVSAVRVFFRRNSHAERARRGGLGGGEMATSFGHLISERDTSRPPPEVSDSRDKRERDENNRPYENGHIEIKFAERTQYFSHLSPSSRPLVDLIRFYRLDSASSNRLNLGRAEKNKCLTICNYNRVEK